MTDAFQKLVELLKLVVTWWFFVEPWEQAIRIRAGKHLRKCGPGVHFRVPFLDSVYVHNTRRMVAMCKSSTVSSADGRVFTVAVSVSYCIADVMVLHTSVHDPNGVLDQRVSQCVAEFINARSGSDVNPRALREHLASLDLTDMGMADASVCITNFAAVRSFRIINDSMTWWNDPQREASTTRKS